MTEASVILGTADQCRHRIEPVWDLADFFLLLPPAWGLPPDKVAFYAGGIAQAFYS